MTELEEQLALLLKDAPGDPPLTLDPDTITSAPAPRRRYVAPMLAAVAVLVLAVPVALWVARGPSHGTPSHPKPSDHLGVFGPLTQPRHPREAAIRAAQTIVRTAPVVPGSVRRDSPPRPMLDHSTYTPGAQHVQRTRFWTAPGTVVAAIAYLRSHRPAGMVESGSGQQGGSGVPANGSLDFEADAFRSLHYTIVTDRHGVAVRADAQVLWAPYRSSADTIPAVTSADVVVVRQDPQKHRGAPTVARTLTGAAARGLASFVNHLPRAIPTFYVSCPPNLGGEKWSDRVVFHTATVSAAFVVDMVGCANATLQVGRRAPIQLSNSFSAAVSGINRKILNSVGLPANYGH